MHMTNPRIQGTNAAFAVGVCVWVFRGILVSLTLLKINVLSSAADILLLLQLKVFHNELLMQLEQKVELDAKYLSVSSRLASPLSHHFINHHVLICPYTYPAILKQKWHLFKYIISKKCEMITAS